MAKKIFSSQEDIQKFLSSARFQLAEMESSLSKKKFQGTNDREITVKFKMDDAKDKRTASIEFMPKAWIKMRALVDTFTGEVQWHGLVERKNINTFIVRDVLIFPHEVTSTTVVSNQTEYEQWLNDLDDEEFNACRLHGHSHVNMGVTPSGTDMAYRHNVLDNFGLPNEQTDLFYIFLITNKREEMSAEIYDLQNNALYSTDEISFDVIVDDDDYLAEFLSEAKSCVKEANYGTSTYASGKQSAPKAKETARTFAGGKKGTQRSYFDDFDDRDDDDWYRRIYGGDYR